MNGLILHCGAQKLERGQLDGLETPAGTRTHRPIGHGVFLNKIIEGLAKENKDYREALEKIKAKAGDIDKEKWPTQQQECFAIADVALKGEKP